MHIKSDIQTNLNAFKTWLNARDASPACTLSKADLKKLTSIIRKRHDSLEFRGDDVDAALNVRVTDEMKRAVSLWEQEPIVRGTDEWRRARLRMIRDMILHEKLDEELSRGLTITPAELRGAYDMIWKSRSGISKWEKWTLRVGLPRMKELNWTYAAETCLEKSQCLVEVCNDVLLWRQQSHDHCEQSKSKRQDKEKTKVDKLEVERAKLKERRKAKKARYRQRSQAAALAVGASGSGSCMDEQYPEPILEEEGRQHPDAGVPLNELGTALNTVSGLDAPATYSQNAIELPFRSRMI